MYKSESKKYLDKNIASLSSSNPGQTFKILKRLGSNSETHEESFMLPSHENLSGAESAEHIATHFSEISQSFPPLSVESSPLRVRRKLENPGCAPEFEVYQK